jgi:hypothetical protein
MTEDFFTIHFNYNNVYYEGRVSPEHPDDTGNPSSYHVVLNNVFFGYLSKNGRHWQVNEQRPEPLVELVGACIENNKHLEEA